MERGGDAAGSEEAIVEIAQLAKEAGVALTIDMESHEWTDFTLDLAIRLFRDGYDVGTVLQTRLERTADDLRRIPTAMRIRMVIGIYQEPKSIAITDKRQMKQRLVTQSQKLLEQGVFVEFANARRADNSHFPRPAQARGRGPLRVADALRSPA